MAFEFRRRCARSRGFFSRHWSGAHRPTRRRSDSGARVRRNAIKRRNGDGDVRGRMLLGRAGRVPARQGRHAGRVGIRRRREGARAVRDRRSGTTGHAETVQVTYDRKVSYGSCCRSFLGRARSDATEPPGSRHGHAVSLGDLSRRARAGERREGVHRATRRRARVPAEDRHDDRAGDGVLPGRGVSPGLPGRATRPIPIS